MTERKSGERYRLCLFFRQSSAKIQRLSDRLCIQNLVHFSYQFSKYEISLDVIQKLKNSKIYNFLILY